MDYNQSSGEKNIQFYLEVRLYGLPKNQFSIFHTQIVFETFVIEMIVRMILKQMNTAFLCLTNAQGTTTLLTFNLLKPTGDVMHQQFNIQQLYVLPTLYLCFLYLSENKQRLVLLTS